MRELLSIEWDIAPGHFVAELGIFVEEWYIGAVEELESLRWVGAALTVSILRRFLTCCEYASIKCMILRLNFVLVC